MKLVKSFVLILILPLMVFSAVVINKPFEKEIMNQKLKDMPELFTYEDLGKALNTQYGFFMISHIPEIEGNKKYFKDNAETIGDFIVKVADSFNAVADIDDKKGKIVFKQLFSTFAKFPAGWNMHETINDLQLNFPNISFKINGDRMYAYGNEAQIKEITPLLNNLEFITNKENSFILRIVPYASKTEGEDFIGYKKSIGNKIDDNPTYVEKVINLRHNDTFGLQFGNRFINIKLDMVKETLRFDNHYELPLAEIYNLGYVFTIEDVKKEYLFEKKETKNYIIEITPNNI